MNARSRPTAALLLATLAAACAPAASPPGSVGMVLPVATPNATPVLSATAMPSPTPKASVGTPTPAAVRPSTSPKPSGKVHVVAGTVYDERGVGVDGVDVTVRSLVDSVPYERTVKTKDGAFEVPDVPEGAYIELVATRPGWTTRRRVGSFQQQSVQWGPYVINFGARPDAGLYDQDPTGAAYYLSDRPEIVAVEPLAGATDVDPTRVAFTLQVSERLDAAARDALAAAIVLWPANEAAGAPQGVDLAAAADLLANEAERTNLAREAVKVLEAGASLDFSASPLSPTIGYQVRPTATWNAAGTEVSFAAPVVVRAGELGPARYQIGLVAGAEPIRDGSGLPLGIAWDGSGDGWPAPGRLIPYAFYDRERYFYAGELADGPELAAWIATHSPVTAFEARRDREAPRLIGLAVRDEGGDLRLALRFDEAMAAFDGTPAGYTHVKVTGQADADAAVEDPRFIRSFVFALGKAADDLVRRVIDGPEGELGAYDPTAGAPPLGAAFIFAPNVVAAEGVLADAAAGRIVVAVDPADPAVVVLTVKGRAGLIDGAEALAVRVVGVADPAGNRIPSSVADEHVVRIAL